MPMPILISEQTNTAHTTAMPNRKIEYIVIHYTAGVTSKTGSAKNTALWFANPNATASSDYIVDDTTIVKYNPDIKNRYTWHCGGNKYYAKGGGSFYGKCTNPNSIGIEVCSNNSTGKMTNANDKYWSFTDKEIANLERLVQHLMIDYNIDADHVIRHYDVNSKPCPGIIGWNEDSGDASKWWAFKEKIGGTKVETKPDVPTTGAGIISGTTGSNSGNNPEFTPYIVKITGNTVNVRKGPGTNFLTTGIIVKKNEIYTIVDESEGSGASKWGRLKSGAGWISLDYTVKV